LIKYIIQSVQLAVIANVSNVAIFGIRANYTSGGNVGISVLKMIKVERLYIAHSSLIQLPNECLAQEGDIDECCYLCSSALCPRRLLIAEVIVNISASKYKLLCFKSD
jgi:hypothetical protein